MARAIRIEFEDAFYHVTARGNEKRVIFKDSEDYKELIEIFMQAKRKYSVIICCYVLMSNHYHLLIGTPNGNLTKAMKFIQTKYAIYFNHRHRRSGHLFQGRYKALLVDKENYFLELSRYIHLNPLRAKVVRRLKDYPWSSYPEYIGIRGSELIEPGIILEEISRNEADSYKSYREFCYEGKGANWEEFKKDIYGGFILASKRVTQEIKERLKKIKVSEEVPQIRKLKTRKSKEKILKEVSKYYKRPVSEVLRKKGEPRKVAIYLLRKHTDLDLRMISELVGGIHYSGISKIVSRLENESKSNSKLHKALCQIEVEI